MSSLWRIWFLKEAFTIHGYTRLGCITFNFTTKIMGLLNIIVTISNFSEGLMWESRLLEVQVRSSGCVITKQLRNTR